VGGVLLGCGRSWQRGGGHDGAATGGAANGNETLDGVGVGV
jgi:hypothetical protein